MAEAKKTTEAEPKPVSPKYAPVLTPAAESSDPAVHQLLAARQTALANGDTDTAAALDQRLNELGYA